MKIFSFLLFILFGMEINMSFQIFMRKAPKIISNKSFLYFQIILHLDLISNNINKIEYFAEDNLKNIMFLNIITRNILYYKESQRKILKAEIIKSNVDLVQMNSSAN